jgi:hypothetical protein
VETEAAAEGGQEKPASTATASLLLRLAAGAGALLIIAALVYFAWYNVRGAIAIVAYPFGIDYGEGIVWQQALLIPGPRMYGPIDHLPFIVFHYPPVYHLVSRAVMAFGVDPLAAGRTVSVAATAVIAICIAWLVAAGLAGRVGRSAVLVGAVTGALLPLCVRSVEYWFPLMRVDMLAIALAFLGVVFAVRAEHEPGWLAPAMLAFVLSVYTKQTELCAPIAALVVLLTVKPRAAILAGLGGAIFGLAALAWLEWLTRGGFLRHIFTYNVNTWRFDWWVSRLREMAIYAILLVAAVASLAVSWLDRLAARRRRGPGAAERSVVVPIVTVWLLLSLVMSVATVGKIGSNGNYFIELTCVCAIAAGMLVGLCWQAVIGSQGSHDPVLRLGLVCLAFALVVVMVKHPPYYLKSTLDPRETAIRESLVQEIAREDRPVLSQDMVLSLRGGQEVPIELAIFHELAQVGIWDERRLLDLINTKYFGFLITDTEKVYSPHFYTPELLAAIARAYPRVQTRGPYVVHYPESP